MEIPPRDQTDPPERDASGIQSGAGTPESMPGTPAPIGSSAPSASGPGAPATTAQAQPTTLARPPRTRTSAAFKSLVAGVVVLILLLIFILENGQSVRISYLGATGHLDLGVALLLAAAGGALLTALIGAARIAQLRRHAHRQAIRRDDAGA